MPSVTLEEIRQIIVSNCMLQVPADSIMEDTLLFGPDSIGLDSLDALQLAVAVENTFGLRVENPDVAREVLRTPGTLKAWINSHRGAT